MFEVCQTPPLLRQHETEIVDSGCTGHFLLVNAPFLDKVKYRTPLTVPLKRSHHGVLSHLTTLLSWTSPN
jgi:hypothetical protein